MRPNFPGCKGIVTAWAGVWFSVLTLALPSAGAGPILLHLRNGDRLTGTIVAEDAQRVVLTNAWNKEIIVPLSEIVRRDNAATPAAVAKAEPPKPAPPPPVPPAPPAKPASPQYWSGEVLLGTDVAFSEKDRQLYSGRIRVNYAQAHFRNNIDYAFTYGKTDGELSANRMDGSVKSDFDLSKRFYVYNLGGAGYDEIRKIDLRYEVGPGQGFHLLKYTNFVLNTELGANYQVQHNSDNTRSELFFYRLAENVFWRPHSKLTLDEKFEFFPQVEDVSEYRFRFETNLRLWLNGHLSFNVTVLDQYDTLPARSVMPNDLQIRSSIGVKF
jgi:putative salt-induced outer membrane protein